MSDWTPQDNNNLNKYLHTVRRIEEHREEKAVKELKKLYRELIKTVRSTIAQYYAMNADPETGALTYARLHAASLDARLLEEIATRMNLTSESENRIIRELVEETYRESWEGMVHAVVRASNDDEIRETLSGVDAVQPEVLQAAVNNPVHGLTLSDQLEKNRTEIVYGIKQAVGVGLSVGDRYDTMARRIQTTLIGPNGTGGSYFKAVRIARTEAHRVREAGNLDAAESVSDKLSPAGFTMMKTWVTMKDERVRPNRRYRTKHGWRSGKPGKYNHVAMDGVSVPVKENFHLPSGAEGPAPGQTGVAGEDINCRCFLKYEVKELTSKAQNVSENDWSGALPSDVSKEEKSQLIKYAESKNVKLVDLSHFDGDVGMLTEQIDTLADLQTQYPVKKPKSLTVRDLEPDTFGEESRNAIIISRLALRNRKCTNINIANGHHFAFLEAKGIVVHEYGHALIGGRVSAKRNIELATRAYYNVHGKWIDKKSMESFLLKNISPRSVTPLVHHDESITYPELGAEIFAKHYFNPNAFTKAYMKILREEGIL